MLDNYINICCRFAFKALVSIVAGLAYGSLHFLTFDGTNYTFKAIGVYVIVRLSSSKGSNVFTLQGETGELETNRQPRQVPALLRLAAYHQTFGKVQIFIFLNDVISLVCRFISCFFSLPIRKKKHGFIQCLSNVIL